MASILYIEYIQFFLPFTLLVLAFLLKWLIDREATIPNFIQALLELPVNMAFLACSFIAAFTISSSGNAVGKGLILFVIYIIGSILVVFLWRRAIVFFEHNRFCICWLLGILNYLLGLAGILFTITLFKK